jgi:hypothetical protein
MVNNVQEGRKPHFNFNGNRWSRGNKPSFHFDSFCPLVLSENLVYDSLSIEPKGADLLSRYDWLFLRLQELKHGCIVKHWMPTTVPKSRAPKDDQWELSFEGPKAIVEKVKDEVKERLKEGGARWVKTN